MKLIVVGEFTAAIREAFKKKGHDAWRCDLIPSEVPGQHLIMRDDAHLQETLYSGQYGWEAMIGHPPCTRLTNSVIWYIKRHSLWQEVREAAKFFMMLYNAPIKKKCLENPVQHGYVRHPNEFNDILIPEQSQSIQPYHFGEDASKRTCLWLDGFPLLQNTSYFPPRIVNGKKRWGNQTDGGWNRLAPSETRGMDRSRTYPGIAAAMADQWG